ncbi:MAG: hypothetical protein WCC64_21615 [Aliidongia sp.]
MPVPSAIDPPNFATAIEPETAGHDPPRSVSQDANSQLSTVMTGRAPVITIKVLA